MLIDSHCHIYLPEFDEDRSELISEAKKGGVTKILMPAIDSGTHALQLKVETEYPDVCISMMGLHPCSVKGDYEAELSEIENLYNSRKFVAVGEIGLDLHWDKSTREIQETAFRWQIEIALKFDLPVVIHSREAVDECIELVSEYASWGLRGVFHCFSGSLDQAKRIMDLNFMIGIGGVVTFKNGGLDKVIPEIGLSHVILETDAPYLAPVPYRGKRNVPAYIKYVVARLAELTGMEERRVGEVCYDNTTGLFRI